MPNPSPDRLKELEARIEAAKAASAEPPAKENQYGMAEMAWRMVIELTASIGIGFGIGYGLDALFGTSPIFMILFFGFGFASGIRTIMRTAQEIQDKQLALSAAQDKEG